MLKTKILQVKGFEDGLVLIEKWLRNKNTLEFIGIWEEINNPGFNSPEFGGIKNEADILNIALFGKTAADWRIRNP